MLKENINVDLSFLNEQDLSQDNSVYPPNIFPSVVSINVIVVPLSSHLLWKSFGVEPSLDFLYNNSVLNFLLLSQFLINFSSNLIFELNKFLSLISSILPTLEICPINLFISLSS